MREGDFRNLSGCAVSAIFSRKGQRFNGKKIMESIAVMHDRSNGLGGGFAAYGIYPEYKEYYAFHVFYDNTHAKNECESFLEEHFDIVNLSKIPTRQIPEITEEPLLWRYFVLPHPTRLKDSQLDERSYVTACVFKVNTKIHGAHIFSSGKNMGVFKAVGYPEDVARFYRLEEYEGYCFTAHGRYPTNTPGWWGGAHPFALLDVSVVHNGEISSYDTNRRAMEMHDYQCTLQTDTEVITYMIDYLRRVQNLSFEDIAHIFAAPFWSTIESMDEKQRDYYTYLRYMFAPQLITGPFSILVGFENGIMALNDRLKLRSLVIGEKDDMVYIASEEAAIRILSNDLDTLYYPKGGEPVIITLERGGTSC